MPRIACRCRGRGCPKMMAMPSILVALCIILNVMLSVNAFSMHPYIGLRRHACIIRRPSIIAGVQAVKPHSLVAPSTAQLYFKTSNQEITPPRSDPITEEDETDEFFIHKNKVDKQIGFMKKLSKGVIPVASTLGFALTPSPSLLKRALGASAGGAMGLVTRSFLLHKADDMEQSLELEYIQRSYAEPSPAVEAALADIIRAGHSKPLITFKTTDIEAYAKKHRVKERELGQLFTHVFAEVVYDFTRTLALSEDGDFSDLFEIMDFIAANRLSTAELGDGLALAALRIGSLLDRDEDGFYVPNYPIYMVKQASQILFLADKLFEKGLYGFYGDRVKLSVHFFTMEECEAHITLACSKLFQKLLEKLFANPNKFTFDEVQQLKKFVLTNSAEISNFNISAMRDAVHKAISELVDRKLEIGLDGNSTIPASLSSDSMTEAEKSRLLRVELSAFDNVRKVNDFLQLDPEEELQEMVLAKSIPVFERLVTMVVNDIFNDFHAIKQYKGVIEERMQSLRIPPHRAGRVISQILQKKREEFVTSATKIHRSSEDSMKPVFKYMLLYSRSFGAVVNLCQNMLRSSKINHIPFPTLPLSSEARSKLFELKKLSAMGKDKISVDGSDESVIPDEMFGLMSDAQDRILNGISASNAVRYMEQCLKEKVYNVDAQSAIKNALRQFKVSNEEYISTAMDFYSSEAARITRNGTPSNEALEQLEQIRIFLDIDYAFPDEVDEDIKKINQIKNNSYSKEELETIKKLLSEIHTDLFADQYIKALDECMSITGHIEEDDINGLIKLQHRLLLPNEIARDLVNFTFRNKMTAVMKGLLDMYKADLDPSKNDNKKRGDKKPTEAEDGLGFVSESVEKGDDEDGFDKEVNKGPNAFMREVGNLVESLTSNILTTQGVDLKSIINSQGEDLTRLPPPPITAVGILTNEELVDIFKHYLVNRVTESNEKLSDKYLANEKVFAYLLGLTANPRMIINIKESVMYSYTFQMISNILKFKSGGLTNQDMQKLAIFREKLFANVADSNYDMNAVADDIYLNACRNAVMEVCEQLFKGIDFTFNYELVYHLRAKIQSFGFEMKDVGFSDDLRMFFYATEVQHLVETGERETIRNDLKELQDSYAISDDQVMDIIQSLAKKLIDQNLNLALYFAKKYNEEEAIKYTLIIMKYAEFLDPEDSVTADGNLFTVEDKLRLMTFYENCETMSQRGYEERLALKLRLKSLISLSKDYIPAIYGIDGILSNKSSNAELQRRMVADPNETKKKWAWG